MWGAEAGAGQKRSSTLWTGARTKPGGEVGTGRRGEKVEVDGVPLKCASMGRETKCEMPQMPPVLAAAGESGLFSEAAQDPSQCFPSSK